MATLKDVAHRAGVSVATASLALRDHSSISIGTKQRVWEAKEALGYRAPMRTPGSLSEAPKKQLHSSKDIAFLLVSREFDDPGYAPTLNQVASYATMYQWRPIHVTANIRDLERGTLPPLLERGNIDAIIVAGDYTAEAHAHLKKLGVPLLMLGRFALGSAPWMSCEPDFNHGLDLFTERMMALGHYRYGLVIDGKGINHATEHLISTYRETLKQKGLELAGVASPQSQREGDFLTINGLLKKSPTALLLGSAHQAADTYEACRKAGMRIPEDISVICFNSARNSIAAPSLAYLDQPPGGARRIVEKLSDLLKEPDQMPTRELFPCRFIPGGSAGISAQ